MTGSSAAKLIIGDLWADYDQYCACAHLFKAEHNGEEHILFPDDQEAKQLAAAWNDLRARARSLKNTPAELYGKKIFSRNWWKVLGY